MLLTLVAFDEISQGRPAGMAAISNAFIIDFGKPNICKASNIPNSRSSTDRSSSSQKSLDGVPFGDQGFEGSLHCHFPSVFHHTVPQTLKNVDVGTKTIRFRLGRAAWVYPEPKNESLKTVQPARFPPR